MLIVKEGKHVSTTLAAVLVAPRTIELQRVAIPEIDEDAGLAKIEITGVCGADWSAYNGQIARIEPPTILGHEIVARVEQIGARAARRWDLKIGDRIVMEEYAPCGTCEFCLSGRYYTCGGSKMEKMYGFTSMDVVPSLWGGYSEYVYLDPRAMIHKIDERVPMNIAPFFVPLANGIRWTHLEAGIGIGDTVAILGPGAQGLACVIAAKEAGASLIVVTGRTHDAHRLELARELGAHHTIDVDAVENVVAAVAALSKGRMMDAVINVTANFPGATQQGMELARNGGIVVTAGEAHGAASFDPDLVFKKELTIKGVKGRTGREIKKAIAIIESGKYPLERLATHHFTLDEVDQAIRTVGGHGQAGAIHCSVLPHLRT